MAYSNIKRGLTALFVGLTCTNAALADCIPPEERFMSCIFENGKAVEVCSDGNFARYTFGRPGQDAELALRQAFGEGAEMIPWSGFGRTIWEAIRVENNGIIYEVYAGFDRFAAVEDSPEYKEHPQFGGINVIEPDETLIAELVCIPKTVEYGY